MYVPTVSSQLSCLMNLPTDPVDLVKAKVQRNALASAPYESPWSIYRRLSRGGFTKLYRGLGVSATRSLFTHGFMWTVLEYVRGEITKGTGHSPLEDVVK